jgi:hypothetical protein
MVQPFAIKRLDAHAVSYKIQWSSINVHPHYTAYCVPLTVISKPYWLLMLLSSTVTVVWREWGKPSICYLISQDLKWENKQNYCNPHGITTCYHSHCSVTYCQINLKLEYLQPHSHEERVWISPKTCGHQLFDNIPSHTFYLVQWLLTHHSAHTQNTQSSGTQCSCCHSTQQQLGSALLLLSTDQSPCCSLVLQHMNEILSCAHISQGLSTSLQVWYTNGICKELHSSALGWGSDTSWNGTGSIPYRVFEIFHWPNPSSTMALWSTQPLIEMSTRYIPWGVKAVGK